ncbi:MAG: VUT family protein [Bdellovibrionales bacterium]
MNRKPHQYLADQLVGLKFTILYVLLIPATGMVLMYVPVYNIAPEVYFTPASFVAGLVYVIRDFAQNEIGRKRIFLAMGLAAFISYHLAAPALAIASVTAFALGELTDWAVYSFSKRPLSQRVLISSAIAVPVDTIVVLVGFGFARPGMLPLNMGNFTIMFTCCMVSALLISLVLRRFEKGKA